MRSTLRRLWIALAWKGGEGIAGSPEKFPDNTAFLYGGLRIETALVEGERRLFDLDPVAPENPNRRGKHGFSSDDRDPRVIVCVPLMCCREPEDPVPMSVYEVFRRDDLATSATAARLGT